MTHTTLRKTSRRPPRQTGEKAQQENSAAVGAEHRLVDECLAGDPAAWESLFQQCHPALLTLTRLLLGTASTDGNLAEEIASRVWYALITEPQRRLAPYDPRRGCSLTTFLAGLARNEIRQYRRGERRRKAREAIASLRQEQHARQDARQIGFLMDEFVDLLTPREKQFLQGYLLSVPDARAPRFSEANIWQLRHRIQRKLRGFLRDR